ncbi:MAG TPA: hypothetical protein VJV78_01735 [Polyangiales bacterium]|nr:hypothetical protein [Polyangiales bacterium]
MKILNARFHPISHCGTHSALVVARVYCDAHGLSLEPVQSALENTHPMLELRCLLERAGPHTYESLLGFNTARWTFETVSPGGTRW